MTTRNLRRIQHNDFQRINPHLTLERINEHSLRNLEAMIKGVLYKGAGKKALVLDGLGLTTAGMTVTIDLPAAVVQVVGDDIRYCYDDNADASVTLDDNSGGSARTDIIEARITTKNAFTDNKVDYIDPATAIVTQEVTNRDYEIVLEFQALKGSSTTPETSTPGTSAILTGTETLGATVDLSDKYLIDIAVGDKGEFTSLDLRGATPAATSRAEIISAFATVGITASFSGDNLVLEELSMTGEFSMFRIKQPTNYDKDAFTTLIGGVVRSGYNYLYQGENPWFKIAEVPVAAGASTIPIIYGVDDTDSWTAEETTIEVVKTFEYHRSAATMDHPDGSVEWDHLSATAQAKAVSKYTEFRGAYAPLYPVSGDATGQKATLFKRNTALVGTDSAAQDWYMQEQEYPVSRIDQEDTDTSNTYTVIAAISEDSANKVEFTPDADLLFSGNHSRIGIYIKTLGSGYTLKVDIHDSSNTLMGSGTGIPAGTGWFYIDLSASLTPGDTYHYHIYYNGGTYTNSCVLGTAVAGVGWAFREMYKATSGKFGSTDEEDVVNLLDDTGSPIVSDRASGADVGYISTGYDYVAVDLSNDTVWANWEYNDFIGVDLKTGRIKLPAALTLNSNTIYAEFNTLEGINTVDAKNILLHKDEESVEDHITRMHEEFETDSIVESTTDNGVEVEGVLLKDNDLEADEVKTNAISDKSGGEIILNDPFVDSDGDGIAGFLEDGTPFYKKIVSVTLSSTSNTAVHGISDFDADVDLISIDYWIDVGTSARKYYEADSSGFNVSKIEIGNTQVVAYIANPTSYPCKICITYKK